MSSTQEAYSTEQETFWAGEFGDQYQQRNLGEEWIASNTAFFSRIIDRCDQIKTITEVGPNIGLNLMAIQRLLPTANLTGIEISQSAVSKLKENVLGVNAVCCSALDWQPKEPSDLVFTKGVLIHINPDALQSVYQKIYQGSRRYILLAEYYSPTPVSIPYRGHHDRLFKRDFAGELMDLFPDLKLRDYGFAWRRDNHFQQDDLTWFLLEK